MKQICSILFVAVLLLSANAVFSQATKVSQISTPVIVDFGVNCSGGQIHDDGVAENGYGWNASAGNPSGFCTKFIPTVYPYKFTKYCIALTKNGSVTNWTFTIYMWKSVNGMPGPKMDSTTVTATGVPTWPTVTFFDFPLPASWKTVTSPDSVFIGIMYDPVAMASCYVGADETTTTPIWPAWATTAAGPWTNPATYWSTYRAFLQRAEGQSAVTYTHDYGAVSFLSMPAEIIKNTTYNIKAKIQNFGTSAETSVPIKFYVDGTQVGSSINLSLAAGQVDSVSFPWTPTTAGSKALMVTSNLATDEQKANDTIRTTVTVVNSALQTIFCDPFTTAGNWTLTMAGGTVPWSLSTSYTKFTMPSTAVVPGLQCDVDGAGSGNTSNATATLTTALNCTGKEGLYLQFDSDWRTLSTSDQAIVDISTNGGTSWTNLVTWNTSRRAATETIPLPTATNMAAVKIRFTCVQPAWDWWWVIDNVCIKGYNAVGITNNGTVPTTYDLSQNYPNPFNPTTAIKFALPKAGLVTLKVYDVLGKEVATLVNETKNAGTYIVDFDASSLSSGVYFYRLDVNGFTSIKKMSFIK